MPQEKGKRVSLHSATLIDPTDKSLPRKVRIFAGKLNGTITKQAPVADAEVLQAERQALYV